MPATTSLPEEDCRLAALLILEEIARRRTTRQALADSAKVSLSTLEKALSGRRPFTMTTIVRIEDALGVSLRGERKAATAAVEPVIGPGHAPERLGSYTRPAVRWIEGHYVTLRPSFGDHASIYAYRTEIYWDSDGGQLSFRESERTDADFTQFGSVSVPHQSGHIYLVTNRHGQFRLVILSRPTIGGEMHGLLATLQAGRGAQLTPVSTPIVLSPEGRITKPAYGRIAPGHACYADYRKLLRRTIDEPFAMLLPG